MADPAVAVLVVDDDEVDRLRIARLLRQISNQDFVVESAVDCASGLERLREGGFDVVLLDFRLPDGTALDFLAAARAADGDGPPVIVQTVHDSEETALGTLAKGAQDYLVKGRFDAADLRRALRYAFERDKLIKERRRLTRELEDANGRIRTLEGLLPMCAYCKSIRDESGTWRRVDHYLEQRTAALISHSLCPACIEKHYPE